MEKEEALGIVALVWLIGSVLLMARSVQRGRELAAMLAARHPQAYEAMGRPRPGFFYSARRDRFSQFIARGEYEDLSDPALAAQFEAYRAAEARLVKSLLASMGVIALLVFAVRRSGG